MALVQVDWNPGPKAMRVFGLSLVVTAALVAGVFGLWLGRPSALWVGGALAVAGVLALVGPAWLRRALYLGLTGPAWVVGNGVSRVLVAVVFYGLITPMGLVARAFGRDPLERRAKKASYWSPLDTGASAPETYERPF